MISFSGLHDRFALPIVSLMLLILTACQTPSKVVEPSQVLSEAGIEERLKKLDSLNDFQFGGGLGIWTDTESISARIQWLQSGENLDLKFTGPLGFGDFQLLDIDESVTLSRGKTVVTSGTSADEVIQRGFRLQAPVPIQELKQWVKGLPGSATQTSTDTEGKLDSLRYTDTRQVLWTVRFKRYVKVGELNLPALISASGGEYSVRLLLKNWTLDINSEVMASKQPNKRLSIPTR